MSKRANENKFIVQKEVINQWSISKSQIRTRVIEGKKEQRRLSLLWLLFITLVQWELKYFNQRQKRRIQKEA